MTQPKFQVMRPLTSEEYSDLEAGILARGGVLVPVMIDEADEVIDGHNRKEICERHGLDFPITVCPPGLSDQEKRDLARALNVQRRQLSQAEKREAVADQLRETPERSDRAIGKALGVDHKTVGAVRREVEAGGEIPQVTESRGADGKTYPRPPPAPPSDDPPPAEEPVARGEKEILAAAKEIRGRNRATRRAARLEKASYRAQAPALDGLPKRYGVVCPDPPWPYEVAPDAEDYGAAEAKYPPMTEEEICALPVDKIAAPDAVCALWCTGTVVADGMAERVLRAWGFTPVTTIPWDKHPDSGGKCQGTGYWLQQDAEYVLIGKRGDIPPPPEGWRIRSPIREEAHPDHSRKPDQLYEDLALAYPELDWLEMFSRRPRLGWTVWGNETSILFPEEGDRERAVRVAQGRRLEARKGTLYQQVEVLALESAAELVEREDDEAPLTPTELVDRLCEALSERPAITPELLAQAEKVLAAEAIPGRVFAQLAVRCQELHSRVLHLLVAHRSSVCDGCSYRDEWAEEARAGQA